MSCHICCKQKAFLQSGFFLDSWYHSSEKCLVTFGAGKRHLSSVASVMLLQITALLKCLVTFLAFKWLLNCVCLFIFHRRSMLKCLVTIEAHKWLFYYVGIIMLIQKKALFKCLFKLCVCTWPLSIVDLPVWVILVWILMSFMPLQNYDVNLHSSLCDTNWHYCRKITPPSSVRSTIILAALNHFHVAHSILLSISKRLPAL